MNLGSVYAATPILQRHGLGLDDLDAWEIHEAFAAQVLACLAAWNDDAWCQVHLGVPVLESQDTQGLNAHGSAIALGYPTSVSGAQMILQLMHSLRALGLRRGMAALCIGGSQGGTMLVEATSTG